MGVRRLKFVNFYLGVLLGLAFCLPCGGMAEGAGSSPAASQLTTSDLMAREVERRNAGRNRWAEELAIAERLFQDGEWEAAQRKFQFVAGEVGGGVGPSGYRDRARLGVAKCLTARAMQKEKAGEVAAAAALFQEARSYDPANSALAKQVLRIQEKNQHRLNPYPDNPAYTKNLVLQTEQIKKLLAQADQLNETGQWNEARKTLDQVLSIDRYNRAALGKIEKLEDQMLRTATKKYEASRTKALAEVSDAWMPPPPARTSVRAGRSTGLAKPSGIVATKNKLKTIRIPEVVFNERSIRGALEELQALSVKWDTASPDGSKGVDLVLQLPPAQEGQDPEAATVTLEVRDTNLETILEYVCLSIRGSEKLRFEPEANNVVVILPISGASEGLEIRNFDLPPSLVAGLSSAITEPAELGKLVLVSMGVNTEIQNSQAVLFRETGKLVVRTTPAELTKIDLRIRDVGLDQVPEIYEIETKFLQFTENDVKNFTANISVQMYQNSLYNPVPPGQNYTPSIPAIAGTPGSAVAASGGSTSGLRGTSGLNANGVSVVALQNLLDPTYPQFASNQIGLNYQILGRGVSIVLQMLQNAIGKDLVAAPRVTVSDGKESKITIARRMYYPTSYTSPTVPSNDQGIGAGFILPSNPTGFEFRDIGVSLVVTAKSTANPGTVDLDFTNLLVDDFEGFIDYGSTISTVTFGDSPFISGSTDVVPPADIPVSQAPYLVPIFSKRSLQTRVRLEDGQTVAMGGLLAESVQLVDDSVPGLGDIPLVGRLFRSEASQKVKSNLIVFCTVKIVGPDGQPLFQDPDITPAGSPDGITAAMAP